MWLQPTTPPPRPPRASTIFDDDHDDHVDHDDHEDHDAQALIHLDGDECRRRSPWRLSNEQPLPASPSPLSPYNQRAEPADGKSRGRVRSIAGELDAQRSKPSALGRLRLQAVVASLQPESAAMVKEVEEVMAREHQLQEQQERARSEAASWKAVTSQSSEELRDELAGLAAARSQSGVTDAPQDGLASESQTDEMVAEQALRRKAEAARKRKSAAAEEAAKWEAEERECRRREAQAAAERDVGMTAKYDQASRATADSSVPDAGEVEKQPWWYSPFGPGSFCAGGRGADASFAPGLWFCTLRPGKREAGCPRPM